MRFISSMFIKWFFAQLLTTLTKFTYVKRSNINKRANAIATMYCIFFSGGVFTTASAFRDTRIYEYLRSMGISFQLLLKEKTDLNDVVWTMYRLMRTFYWIICILRRNDPADWLSQVQQFVRAIVLWSKDIFSAIFPFCFREHCTLPLRETVREKEMVRWLVNSTELLYRAVMVTHLVSKSLGALLHKKEALSSYYMFSHR